MLTVGAIIVCWNSKDTIKKCLKSIEEQIVQFDRVIVIDNDIDNNSTEESIRSDYNINDLTYIKMKKNVGFAKANNIALELLSDCSWIATINPDAFLHPMWLKNLLVAVERYPRYTFFASRLMMHIKEGYVDGVGDEYHISGLAWRIGHGFEYENEKERDVFSPCAAAAFYQYEAVIEAGGFDEDFFCYFEDVELGFRLRLYGHQCRFIPNAIASHIGSASTGGKHSDFAIYHGHRNLVWTYIKNMPGILFLLFLPVHLTLNIVSVLWFANKGKFRVIAKAKIDAISQTRTMWKKRKDIQKRRKCNLYEIIKIMDKRIMFRHH